MWALEYTQRTSACRKRRTKRGEFPALKGRGAQGWEPLSPCITIPTKQDKRYKMKMACLNVQGCNDPAKRECVGRMFVERGLDV